MDLADDSFGTQTHKFQVHGLIFEKLTVCHLVSKFTALYGTHMFMDVFTITWPYDKPDYVNTQTPTLSPQYTF